MKLATLEVTSPAFRSGGWIPRRHAYLGEGRNVSPPLRWDPPPRGTVEQVLICDDPDAPGGDWVHWVLYRIPPEVTSLPEGLPAGWATLERAAGARQGTNSWGELGWGGPMPPQGHGVHHYRLRIYAVDRPLGLAPGADMDDVLEAMEGHVLASGELVGTYER